MSQKTRKILIKIAVMIALVVVLSVFNRLVIGEYYTFRTVNNLDSYMRTEVTSSVEGAVEVVSVDYKDGIISVKLDGKKVGETALTFTVYGENGERQSVIGTFYVHSSDFITEGGYIGTTNNFFVIGIEVVLLFLFLLIHRIRLVYKTVEENMYSYAVPGHMGVALFLFACVVLFLILSIRQGRVFYKLPILLDVLAIVFGLCAYVALPVLLLLSLLMLVSNVILIKREGRSLSNMLGIALGFGLLGLTFGGNIIWTILYNMDTVGNSSFRFYLMRFFDAFSYTIPVYLECLMASTLICTLRAQSFVPAFDKDYIIILGCAIMKDGSLTPLLKSRVDRALWFAKKQKEETGKDIIFVPSGGQGSDEVISEAQAMKNYLLEQGVDEEHILLEDKSTNTRENMLFSKKLIEERTKDARVAFATTSYHVFRSGNIARGIGLRATGLGSKTKWYFYINALVREFVANLSAEKKVHIINMAGFLIYAFVIAFLSYITD